MSGRSWGVSIALGFFSLPLGFLARLIPNPPIEKLFITLRLTEDPNLLPVISPEKEEWNQAINTVRDNLHTFAQIRGSRMRSSSFVRKSRSARLEEAGIQL
jgi:P-type Ca2+ transporter type 2C